MGIGAVLAKLKDEGHVVELPKQTAFPATGDWSYGKAVDRALEVINSEGLEVIGEADKGGKHIFKLRYCFFNQDHTNNDAAIMVSDTGQLEYNCFHNSCQDKRWSDVSARFNSARAKDAPTQNRQKTEHLPVKQLDVVELVTKFYRTGVERGLSTGWQGVDELYTVLPGQWTLLTGIPSHGKSSWLDALLVNLANIHGWKFGVFSPENYPLHLHISKLIEVKTGLPFFGTFNFNRMPIEEVEEGAKWVSNVFKFIDHGDSILTVEAILAKAQSLVNEYHINGMVIDPWNEIDHILQPGDTETMYISKSLTKVRHFARKNNIHVWIVAHPTKMPKNDQGKYDPPTPYDVAGGAHWRNKADNSITIHRPCFDRGARDVEVHVQKVRFKHIGRPGKVTMQYQLDCGRYVE